MTKTILIEGCDLCGKTTLARMLSARLGLPYVHFGVPEPDTDLDAEYRAAMVAGGVIDRAWLSELVYGSLARGDSSLTLAEVYELNLSLLARGGTLVVCHAPNDVVAAKFRERARGEYLEAVEAVLAVNDTYLALWRLMSGPGVLLYDWTTDPSAEKLTAEAGL